MVRKRAMFVLVAGLALAGCGNQPNAVNRSPVGAGSSLDAASAQSPNERLAAAARTIGTYSGRSDADIVAAAEAVCAHAASGLGDRMPQDVLINDHHVQLDDDLGRFARLSVRHLCMERSAAVDEAIAFDRLMRSTPATGPSTPSTVAPAGDDATALCDSAAAIRALDDRAADLTADAMASLAAGDDDGADAALARAVRKLAAMLPELRSSYDAMEAAVPSEYRSDVVIVRSFTVRFMKPLSNVRDAAGLRELVSTMDPNHGSDSVAAAGASLRLDRLTRDRCGVAIVN
jgi:hypothetical protein